MKFDTSMVFPDYTHLFFGRNQNENNLVIVSTRGSEPI